MLDAGAPFGHALASQTDGATPRAGSARGGAVASSAEPPATPLLQARGRAAASLSHGVGHVQEDVIEAEAFAQILAQALHAEGLRRVVAGGDHVHA